MKRLLVLALFLLILASCGGGEEKTESNSSDATTVNGALIGFSTINPVTPAEITQTLPGTSTQIHIAYGYGLRSTPAELHMTVKDGSGATVTGYVWHQNDPVPLFMVPSATTGTFTIELYVRYGDGVTSYSTTTPSFNIVPPSV